MAIKTIRSDLLNHLKNTLLVILGTFILAIGTELFIIPAGLDTGGISGIAICFSYGGVNIDPNLIITALTWILFFMGLIFLGWQFSLQTLCSTITYPICLYFLSFLASKNSWLLITESPSLVGIEGLIPLLSALFGGVFVGTGCVITFLGGGSTGGVDIITFVICKFFRFIKSSYSIFAIDAIIVLTGFIFTKDLALCLEGVLSAFITALVIDKIFSGSSQNFVAYIVTSKYEEITNDIIKKLDQTTTIMDIEGGYTKEPKKMVMFSFSVRNYATLRAIISANDKNAFMTINKCHEINGEGFKPID